MLFDTHAHLDDTKFDCDRFELIDSFPSNDISLVLNVGADLKGSIAAVELANKYDYIYAAVGLHPYEALSYTDDDLLKLRGLLKHNKVKALGEIGLDYHGEEPRDAQAVLFQKQLDLAKEENVPVIIHDREAHEDCFDILSKYNLRGVFHCFSGSKEYADRLLQLGFYISFTGVITFSNANKLKEVVKHVPIDRMFIETDCPYLSPEPYRGSRNSPLNVKRVAQQIAELKGIPYEDVCRITKQNAMKFFNIDEAI